MQSAAHTIAAPAEREVDVRFSDHAAAQCGVAWQMFYNLRPGELSAAIVGRILLRSPAAVEPRQQPTGDVALVGATAEDRDVPLVYIDGMSLAEVRDDLAAWTKERRRG